MVASKFAKQLIDAMPYGFLNSETEAIYPALDAELQEVRAVLSLTADRRYPSMHGHCWCRKDLTDDKEPHGAFCQRARALLEKLEVRP